MILVSTSAYYTCCCPKKHHENKGKTKIMAKDKKAEGNFSLCAWTDGLTAPPVFAVFSCC